MKVNLGFMKIPFEGPLNHAMLLGGIVWACFWVTLVFNIADMKGPAVYATNGVEFSKHCQKTILVTVLWCGLYYNYVGTQLLSIFTRTAWEMYDEKDVTEKQVPNAARFAGNMFEQSCVFLPALWMYTLFCDYETGWALGVLYLVSRLYYPFMYMIFRSFTFWFEFCTQIGYGVNGLFLLGCFYQACGKEWVVWAKDNQIGAGIAGYFVGCFITLGVPLAPIYAFIHYKLDNKVARKAAVAASDDKQVGR